MTDGGYTKTEAWNLQLQARIERVEAERDAANAECEKLREGVRRFARVILHGNQEHRDWLLSAADAFCDGRPLPSVSGLGRAEQAEAALSAANAEIKRLVSGLRELLTIDGVSPGAFVLAARVRKRVREILAGASTGEKEVGR